MFKSPASVKAKHTYMISAKVPLNTKIAKRAKALLLSSVLLILPLPSLQSQTSVELHTVSKTSQMQVVKAYPNPIKSFKNKAIFNYEPELDNGVYTYIIELNEPSVAQHTDAIKTLREHRKNLRNTLSRAGTSISNKELQVLNSQLQAVTNQQALFLQEAKLKLQGVKAIAKYQYAINGVALRITQNQAKALSELDNVYRITRERQHKLQTDVGPTLIGAAEVWNGAASADLAATQGEGVIVGIIDSGINTDHPSFAEQAGDGFVHTNPLGNNVFLGDCALSFPQLCNNKLIGVYSYPVITDNYSDTEVFPPNTPENGEDYGGHGSHVASTAAGNVLNDVDEVIPEFGEVSGSGIPTGFVFEQISGVAPRANIISYQVCFGGTSDNDDTYGDCVTSAILLAIEDAIQDGVDVINFSISGGGDPWSDNVDLAFLSARNAGVFVAASAGNSGSQASSTDKFAPWYTSVAASEHGRETGFLKQLINFSGGASDIEDISGQSNSGSISAAIVYAGNFSNSNDPFGDPAQCLEPFPENTFSGQIVVCDRGEIARVEKAQNVAAGGAGGYVLANVEGGETFLANDEYIVPGIHINAENGAILKNWLSTGSDHRARITQGEASSVIQEDRIDVIADFSSRGPNTFISTLAPTLSAPGVNIYAAYADQQLGHDGDVGPAPSDFDYSSGTSMSSPHVAGAAALIKSAHPSWDADEIRSALSFTATTQMLKEDAINDADFFDMGAGRVQVDQAIATGLVMSESDSNYAAADPDLGGDPRDLNIPSITDDQCPVVCSWTRTFTATTDATWTFVDNDSDLNISATPSSFTLLQGQTQEVEFTISSNTGSLDSFVFGIARFTSPGLPDVNIPVSVLISLGNLPSSFEIEARRNADSVVFTELEGIDVDDVSFTVYEAVRASKIVGELEQDSDPSDYLDDLDDGLDITQIEVPVDAVRLVTKIQSTNADDLDLFIVFDENADGELELNEQIASSQRFDSNEEIAINFPDAGDYFIVVQNFSSASISDFELRYAVVESLLNSEQMQIDGPSSIASDESFELRITHDFEEAETSDDFYTAISVGREGQDSSLGTIVVDIERVDDDVSIQAEASRIVAGQSASFSVVVAPNNSNEDREYIVSLPVPVGTSISDFSSANSGSFENNQVTWTVVKPAGDNSETLLNAEITALSGIETGPINIQASSIVDNLNFTKDENTQVFTDIQIEGPPEISFNGEDSFSLRVVETLSALIPLQVFEPNNDEVSVTWEQSDGPLATINEIDGEFTLIAPNVDEDSTFSFVVTASDGNGNSDTATMTLTVINDVAPVINSITAPTSGTAGQSISISIDASDVDSNDLSFSIDGSEIQGNSATRVLPSTGNSISYTISVSDGINVVSQTISVSITQASNNANSGSGGGSIPLWTILVLALALGRRHQTY